MRTRATLGGAFAPGRPGQGHAEGVRGIGRRHHRGSARESGVFQFAHPIHRGRVRELAKRSSTSISSATRIDRICWARTSRGFRGRVTGSISPFCSASMAAAAARRSPRYVGQTRRSIAHKEGREGFPGAGGSRDEGGSATQNGGPGLLLRGRRRPEPLREPVPRHRMKGPAVLNRTRADPLAYNPSHLRRIQRSALDRGPC